VRKFIIIILKNNELILFTAPAKEAKMTLEQPAGEMWQKIREELNEKQETKEQDLGIIKEWLKQEPHLPDEFGKDLMFFKSIFSTQTQI
jgi:hypothetical protein